jgi:dipeptidyl aminopeptidase/acylaminoacyl peptidase
LRRIVFLFVLIFSLPTFSQVKHPFTFEDMMKLKRVGEPVPSPDGKWVLFAAVDVDLAANKKTSHIWIVPLAGGQERLLIADQDGDRPRWDLDGKRFAFLSNKEGGLQIWIADFDGAAGTVSGAHKLTSIATEAGGELWSPDGKHILFTSDVYPECDGAPGPAAACNEKQVKEAEESKVKAIIFDRLLYRHWNAYKRGMRTHIFIVSAPPPLKTAPAKPAAAQRIEQLPMGGGPRDQIVFVIPRDLTPGDYNAPVFSLGGQDDYAFSPDGQEICYTSNHDKVEATSTNNDLWIVSVNGGTAKNITAENPASDSTPLYSPDGKYIAYRAQQRPGYESDRFRLMLYDRKTGEKKNLTEDLDEWVGSIVWTTNSRTLIYAAESKGLSLIHRIDIEVDPNDPIRPQSAVLSGGRISGLTGGTISSQKPDPVRTKQLATPPGFGHDDDPTITSDGEQVLFTRMSISAPTEIYHVGVNGGENEKLTHVNDATLSQIAMLPLETFWFTGARSDKVQGFFVRPPNFDATKKYPLKFIIHGGPEVPMGDLWSYRWNAELFAASGYVVIMINFHGSPGYGQKFIDEINGDWGGAPFEDLMKGLDYAEKTFPFIDKDRECALGASYGGYMANWVLGHTDRFKCIVSHDGMFNTYSAWGTTEELWFNNWEFKGTPYTNPEMYEKWNPRNFARNFKTPTLVIHGQLDYRLDVSEGFQLFTTLQTMGVPSKMLYFPDEGHWVLKPQNSRLWYKTVNDWVDQWTGTKK